MVYDINLIPKAKVKTSGSWNAVIISLSVIVIIFLLLFGFYLPFRQKLQLKSQIRKQADELLALTDIQETYTSLLAQIDGVKQSDTIMDMIKSGNLKMTDVLTDIESSIPENIYINEMILEAGLLTINGASPSYTEVADFIVNLRKMEKVAGVTFMSASIDEKTAEISEEDSAEVINSYNFTVYIRLNTADVLAALITAQTTAAESTEQEADTNEAN